MHSQDFISRKDIAAMTGLGKAAVARLVELPGFPAGTWLNARVVLYPRVAVEAFLASGQAAARAARRTTISVQPPATGLVSECVYV